MRPRPASGALAPVELRGDGLLLRVPQPGDVPAVAAACRDPQTQRWTTVPVPYTEEHAVSFVEDYAASGWAGGTLAVFAITEGDGRYAGAVDLRLDGTGMGEVGYAVAPWSRGRGVASAALRLVCRWGFESLALARIEWWAHVGNLASRRTAERVGFVVEGTCRQRLLARGERRDAWVGGLLPEDLR